MPKNSHIHMPENHMDSLYNSKNFLIRFVHLNRLHKIGKEIPSNPNFKILDAGCGEGHLIQRLNKIQKRKYYGVDITDIALEKAKKRCPNTKHIKSDLTNMPFRDNFFDVVICTEVLEHIYNYKAVLKEIKRVLRKGGILIITFPNEPLWTLSRILLGRRPIKVPDHVNSFTPHKMKKLVNLQLLRKISIPAGFPFFLSLNCIMKFKK